MTVRKKESPSVLETFLALRGPLESPEEEWRTAKPNLIDSLALASARTLQDFRLSRLASAANLQKDLLVIFEEIIDQHAQARLAELLLHHAERNLRKTTPLPEESGVKKP